MKLLYAAYIRLPTEKAHGAQIMHTCSALAKAGNAVTLAIPGRRSAIKENPFSYYSLKENFPLTPLQVPDFLRIKRLGFLLSASFFALRCASYARSRGFEAAYTRDRGVALLLSLFLPKKIKLVFEAHGEEPRWLVRLLARRAGFVGITAGVRDMLLARGAAESRAAVAHDGVELEDFSHSQSKDAARSRLGLPHDKKIAMYVGRLDGWKGAETLLKASKLLPPSTLVAIIGGEPSQIEMLKPLYPKALFLGYHEYRELGDNQAAADVLVLPNTARDKTSLSYTSPLKLFSYMASGRPIVASDLPSLREVISERSAFFAKPDDPEALSQAIEQALGNPEGAAMRAAEAKRIAADYSWDARAKIISSFISTLSS